MIEAFLLGAIATASFTAGVFFLKFWSATRDFLFLAFAVFFLVEGINRVALLLATRPNEGSPWIYLVRLLALGLILGAIVRKKLRRQELLLVLRFLRAGRFRLSFPVRRSQR